MQLAPLGSVPQLYQISVVKPCFKKETVKPQLWMVRPLVKPLVKPLFLAQKQQTYNIINIINIWPLLLKSLGGETQMGWENHL